MEEGGERRVGGYGAFVLEVADLEVEAFDVSVELGLDCVRFARRIRGLKGSNALLSLLSRSGLLSPPVLSVHDRSSLGRFDCMPLPSDLGCGFHWL